MIFTIEIPNNAKDIKVSVTCDRKQFYCKEPRYAPGYWNGLQGGRYYGQYFSMDDEIRIREMIEVASALSEYGIEYILTKMKRQYRIMISEKDYRHMDEELKKKITCINFSHDIRSR